MTVKPPKERVRDLRARRELLGLKRLELYAHPADHEPIKLYAASLLEDRDPELKREKERKQ